MAKKFDDFVDQMFLLFIASSFHGLRECLIIHVHFISVNFSLHFSFQVFVTK